MKLGDFFIKLGVKGDVKKLDEVIQKMERAKASDKTRLQFKERIVRLNRLIAKATKQEQVERLKSLKAQVRDNYANDLKLKKLKEQRKALIEQKSNWAGIVKGAASFAAAISTAVVLMDRLGNKVLQVNQMYTNFAKQTGISINSFNRLAGVAKLSGMNLPAEQVASDLTNLQQRIFKLTRFGQGSGIFAQLGMNPMGMNADQFLMALRERFKTIDTNAKPYVLDELGLSREWLNVLELADNEFIDLVKQSSKLQLSEQERKELAKYTLIQQKNNMRWELAKQRFIIAFLPIITKVMEKVSEIALAFSNSLGNEKVVAVVRDIALWIGIAAANAARMTKNLLLTGLFGGGMAAGGAVAKGGKGLIGGLLGLLGIGAGKKAAGKVGGLLAKRAAVMGTTAALGAETAAPTMGVGGIIAIIAEAVLALWTILDVVNLISEKDDEKEDEQPTPTELTPQLAYQSVNSNMTNHFYNNPAPQQEITDELNNYISRYLSGAKK